MMWRLLYIRPSAQAKVATAIADLARAGRVGLEAYYPRERIWTGIGPRRRPVDRALLPSMIFVHAGDDDLDAIMKVHGVYRRLDPHGTSQAIAVNAFIGSLKLAEDSGLYDKTLRKGQRIEIGQRVKIGTGPYAGMIATITSLSRSGRAKLVVELYGREQRADADVKALEPLDAVALAAA